MKKRRLGEGGGNNGSPEALNTSPDALNPWVNRGSFEPGLSCSSVVACCLRGGDPLGDGDDKENRRV